MSLSNRRWKKRSAAVHAGGLLVLALLTGCAKQPPTLLNNLHDPKMSREELRARVYDFVLRFAGQVERSVHTIVLESNDVEIGRAALVWVSSAVPAVQSAAFRSDPAAGLMDVWALCLQQLELFESGGGSELGEWHELAVRTSRELVVEVEDIGKDLMSPDDYSRVKATLESWAADHPIETLLFTRETTGPMAAALLGPISGGVFASVGSMSDELSDLSDRMSIYAELMPKQARWQAGLLLTAQAGGMSFTEMIGDIDSITRDINSITGDVQQVTALLDSLPRLLSSERAIVMNDITAERIAVMREINEMLAATLEAVAEERIAVMQGITQERIAAFQELDAIASRLTDLAVDHAMQRVNGAVDHFYWRAIQILAVLVVLLFIAGFLVVRALGRRTGGTAGV